MVLIAALALLLSPLLARRNHVKFFHQLHHGKNNVWLEWSDDFSHVQFSRWLKGKEVPLDRWLGATGFQHLTRGGEWTISQQVESISMSDPLPEELLRELAYRIPQCNGLVTLGFDGVMPGYFARQLERSQSLAALLVEDSEDCEEVTRAVNQCNNLQMLMFIKSKLSPEDMQRLATCKHLQFVAFIDSEIPTGSIETLRKELPYCQISKPVN